MVFHSHMGRILLAQVSTLLLLGPFSLASPAPYLLGADSVTDHLNASANVKSAIQAEMPSIASPSLGPITPAVPFDDPDQNPSLDPKQNPNLLPLLIYQGTDEEPCSNINSGLKPTQYIWPYDVKPDDKTEYPHCWDFGLHNITCLIIGRVGRTFADMNGLIDSNCGPSGPSEFGQLGIYNDSFGNAYTWTSQNGGGISSFSFAPYLNRPLPPSLQPKPLVQS